MENIYSKKVMEHFQKPHNVGRMEKPDGTGKVGNVVCGDLMQLYIKIGKDKKGREVIKDAKFETFGCAAAISTSSVVTDLVKGKTIEEALEMSSKDIIDSLGGLPPIKIHCSLLGIDALYEAIYDYLLKNKRQIPEKLEKLHQRIEKNRNDIGEGHGDLE